MSENNCCFKNILCTIEKLQNSVDKVEDVANSCDRPFLGNCCNNVCCYNTRPITFYSCNNEPMTLPYSIVYEGNTTTGTSSVLRLAKINDGCCCTCMVLAPNPDNTQVATTPYVATCSYVNINLDCVCAMRCLPDTFISCI